ncbi:uncharacterized protein [Eleutherodactylus coqui]|uniref:uncharacterized protein n=1 Tax=Eleutherodactylus coqui TaxID=57060 RepID=UPI003462455E
MVDTGCLVVLMENFPALWNTNSEEYQDKDLKERQWEELSAQIYGTTWTAANVIGKKDLVDKLKKKWRSARDQFRREYTRVPRSGSSGKRKHKYVHFDQLLYLRQTMGTHPVSDNQEETKAEEGSYSESVVSPSEASTETSGTQSTNLGATAAVPASVTPTLPPRRRARLGQPDAMNLQIQMQRALRSSLQQLNAAQDSCSTFGRLVASLMRQIPEDQRQQTESFMLYLMQMATPPNSATQLHALIDNYRHSQIQLAAANVQPPPPPPPQPQPPENQFPQHLPQGGYLQGGA